MASEAVRKFIAAVNDSADLRKKAEQALDGSSGPAGFVAVAKDAGFQFSEDDARTYFAEVLTPRQPRELKDEDLAEVSGGKDISLRGPSALNEAVKMFQSMSFQHLPNWTGFQIKI